MRVLHVTPYFAPAFVYGGPPRSVLGLCRALVRRGIDVRVLTTAANGGDALPGASPEEVSFEGVAVRYLPPAFPRRMFGARGLGAALDREVARHDVVHIHGLWNLPAWRAAHRARAAGVPYVLSPRGMLDAGSLAGHPARKRLLYGIIEHRNLAGAALIHATSAAEARGIEERKLGVPVAVLPNGVDPPVLDRDGGRALRRRLGLPPESPLVAFLGRIHPIKRLDLLAGAFARVRATRPDARLVIAGPDEAGHRGRVEPAFGAAAPAVHWTGELSDDDKWALLSAAAALVMCSDSESFGTSVLEALAAGVPVVVTRTCPWQDVVRARCGYWVPQTAEAIGDALLRLVGDPVAAREMGDRGRALARDAYSWDAISRTMAEHYAAVVSRAAGLS